MSNFNQIFDRAWEEKLRKSVMNFSARTSWCSDIPVELQASGEYLTCPRSCLAVLAVLPLVLPSTRNYFLIDNLRAHIGRMAENYNNEGLWTNVASLLERTTSLDVYSTWTIILNMMSTHDFFGNFLPEMERAIRSLRVRTIHSSVMKDTRPIKKPQRKRGYHDKGSRRDPSQWLPRTIPSDLVSIKPKNVIKIPPAFAWFDLYKRE